VRPKAKAKRAAKEKAPVVTKPKKQRESRTNVVRESTKGATLGAMSTLETPADNSEGLLLRVLLILLYGLPILLIIASLVPLEFEFVPERVADGWREIRVPVALGGLGLLMIEGFVYLLSP
jgi:hypothetical protein